ncbi:hypothetical protein [Chelativorans xinjiangense]|uniref:hypothetical protein n=1 Tax=Chelativorans xinjiangense TaxID=2681485 RepID=UPI00135C2385|nr:hypothetical protein [Chelativorans xinjiangense]
MNEAEITTEEYREYHYGDGDVYRIDGPVRLWWKRDEDGDSHRILDASGVTHYPRRGWVAITWKAPSEPVSF